LSEKGPEEEFLLLTISLKSRLSAKEKERKNRKSEEEEWKRKKAMVAPSVFLLS